MSEAVASIDGSFSAAGEDEAALQRPPRWRWLLYLLAFSPVIAIGFAVAANAVDIPVWDGWERGEMWRRYHDGTLDFKYLYSPHIEHRSLFPRLIQLAYGGLFGGDTRAEVWTTFALVAGTCLLAFRVLSFTLGTGIALWPAAFLVNALLCCPLQYPDLLWPVQLAFMMPPFCLAAILATAVSRLPAWGKCILIVLAAEVGTHSFSQGLMLWPVAICLPIFSPRGFGASLKRRLILAGLVALIGALTIYPYFNWNFKSSSHSSHSFLTSTGETPSSFSKLKKLMEEPREVREYTMRSLGNPVVRMLSRDPEGAARDIGRGIMLLFMAAMAFLFWRRKDGESWERLLPWTAAAWFALCTALLLGLGRAAMSGDRSVMPRYVPMTLYMFVALVVISAYAAQWWMSQSKSRRDRARRAAWGWGAAGVVTLLLANQWIYGLNKMSAWRAARLEARATLVYLNLFDPDKHDRLDSNLEFLRRQANYLHSRGLLNTPLAEEWGFGPFSMRQTPLEPAVASLSAVRFLEGDIAVHGFALLPHGRPADGVLVSVRSLGTQDWQVIGFAEMRDIHIPANVFLDDVFSHGHDLSPDKVRAGFLGTAKTSEAPPGDLEILCWALDAHHWQAHPIGKARALVR